MMHFRHDIRMVPHLHSFSQGCFSVRKPGCRPQYLLFSTLYLIYLISETSQ